MIDTALNPSLTRALGVPGASADGLACARADDTPTRLHVSSALPPTHDPSSAFARPKRVLFFDHTGILGGGEIALLNLVREIDRSRFFPVVLLASGGPLVDRLRAAGIETHVLPLAPSVLDVRKDSLGLGTLTRLRDAFCTLRYLMGLVRFIRDGRFELIHTNSLKSDLIGGLAGRLAGVPVVWHVRDRIAADYLPRKVVAIFQALSRLIPHFVIVNSCATLDALYPSHWGRNSALRFHDGILQNTGLGSRRTKPSVVVHDGLPVDGGLEPGPRATAVRNVGLVGRISPWKGQHIFLQAAARVRERFPGVRFQIVGAALFSEKAYEAEIRALSTSLGLDASVEFTGFREDISRVLPDLEILVHASTTAEPFGQVIIEGMLAGKPVVATRGGGVLEIVEHGKTGLLVPMGEPGAMAEAICELLANADAVREMGRCGRQRVLERFTIAHTARKVEAVYDYLLRRR